MYDYSVVYSKRKTVSLQVNENGKLIVKAPYCFPKEKIDKLVNENTKWIEKQLQKQQVKQSFKCELTDADIILLKDIAKSVLTAKTKYYAEIMGVNYGCVKITSAQKCFGSCSGKNDICYSYLLMLYPEKAIDYVVIHELAHTVHHNHSKSFYNFVADFMPDYKDAEKLLKGPQKLPF